MPTRPVSAVAVVNSTDVTLHALEHLIAAFDAKAKEFKNILKMGRTQLQDAVPMTLGQEFHAFAVNLREEIKSIKRCQELLLEVNLGATAIGTGLNTPPEYSALAIKRLARDHRSCLCASRRSDRSDLRLWRLRHAARRHQASGHEAVQDL